MKRVTPISVMTLLLAPLSQAAITVTTNKLAGGSPPSVSNTDLAQSQFLSSNVSTRLFNGNVGNEDNSTGQEVQIDGGSSVLITFDTSVNTFGYDITKIFTVAGWSTGLGGRSNQGYGITLTFVDNSTAVLLAKQTWEANSDPASYYTTVNFTSGDTALNADGVTASGVKSITFTNFDTSRAPNNLLILREFDIEGFATIPEPTTSLLALLGLGGLLRRRR